VTTVHREPDDPNLWNKRRAESDIRPTTVQNEHSDLVHNDHVALKSAAKRQIVKQAAERDSDFEPLKLKSTKKQKTNRHKNKRHSNHYDVSYNYNNNLLRWSRIQAAISPCIEDRLTYPMGYMAVGYLLFLQEQIKDFIIKVGDIVSTTHTPLARRVPDPFHESYTACIVGVARATSAEPRLRRRATLGSSGGPPIWEKWLLSPNRPRLVVSYSTCPPLKKESPIRPLPAAVVPWQHVQTRNLKVSSRRRYLGPPLNSKFCIRKLCRKTADHLAIRSLDLRACLGWTQRRQGMQEALQKRIFLQSTVYQVR